MSEVAGPAAIRGVQARPSLHSVLSAMTGVSRTSDSSSTKKRERQPGGGGSVIGVRRRGPASSHGGDGASTISGSKSSRSLQSSVWAGGTKRRSTRPEVPAITVRDEDGVDVTPKSLLSLKPTVVMQPTNYLDFRAESANTRTPSDWETGSTFSVGLSIAASDTPSVASMSAASTPRSVHKSTSLSDVASVNGAAKSVKSMTAATPRKEEQVIPEPATVAVAELEKDEEVVDPDALVSIQLAETETEWLISIESCCVDEGSPASEDAKDRNSRYEALLKKNKMGNESLVAREAQTVVPLFKCKEIQVSPPASKEAAAQASESDIADCFATDSSFEMPSSAEEGTPQDAPTRRSEEPTSGQAAAAASAAEAAEAAASDGKINTELMRELGQEPCTWIDVDPNDQFPEAVAARQRADVRNLLGSDDVRAALHVLERAIVQNAEHEVLRSYRAAISGEALPEPPAASSVSVPAQAKPNAQAPKPEPAQTPAQVPPPRAVQLLWQLRVPGITDGKTITCLVWSAQEDAVDKIAVGYGSFDSRERFRSQGLILIWSTRNMRHPEQVIRTKLGVTSLAFSTRHTSLLAAGMADGELHVYNLSRTGKDATTPALTSADSATRHSDPVWDIRWVEQQSETGSTLVSAATDGRVLQWSMRRGLEVKAELMRLNAGPNPARTHGSQGGAGALRYAGALTADFHPFLKSIYVVGTEGGTCHKCSASYSDQYLQTFVGHVGPVLKVRWSPFHPAAFLTAGADWTLRLWDHDRPSPCLSLNLDSGGKGGITEPAAEYPTDICWSATSSTVFACVTGKSFQIWDVANSTMDPVHVEKTTERQTGVLFSPKGNVIATASDNGTVSIYRILHPALVHTNENPTEEAQERARLEAILDASARQ